MSAVDTARFREVLLAERQRVLDAISYLHEETPGSLEDETEEIVGSVDKEADFSDEEEDELAYAADPDDSDF